MTPPTMIPESGRIRVKGTSLHIKQSVFLSNFCNLPSGASQRVPAHGGKHLKARNRTLLKGLYSLANDFIVRIDSARSSVAITLLLSFTWAEVGRKRRIDITFDSHLSRQLTLQTFILSRNRYVLRKLFAPFIITTHAKQDFFERDFYAVLHRVVQSLYRESLTSWAA